jgi:hypothetical protein
MMPERSFSGDGLAKISDLEVASGAAMSPIVARVQLSKEYFHRSLEVFANEDATFRPSPGMLSVIGQVLHVSMGMELMLAGAFGPFDGFGRYSKGHDLTNMDWLLSSNRDFDEDSSEQEPPAGLSADGGSLDYVSPELMAATASQDLPLALIMFDRTIDTLACKFGAFTPAQLMTTSAPPSPMWTDQFTLYYLLDLVLDHNAHHRGALSSYARLLGKSPKLPYFDAAAARAKASAMARALS